MPFKAESWLVCNFAARRVDAVRLPPCDTTRANSLHLGQGLRYPAAMFALPASLLIAVAAGQSPAPAPASSPAPSFVCRTEGLKGIADVTPDRVCARFRAEIEKRLGRRIRTAAANPAGAGDWIRVDIRFSRGDTATATLSQRRRGKLLSHMAQSISVSDRKINIFSVEQLARVVAAQIKLR